MITIKIESNKHECYFATLVPPQGKPCSFEQIKALYSQWKNQYFEAYKEKYYTPAWIKKCQQEESTTDLEFVAECFREQWDDYWGNFLAFCSPKVKHPDMEDVAKAFIGWLKEQGWTEEEGVSLCIGCNIGHVF